MAWINKWTIIVGIVFLVHIILLLVYKIRSREKDDENEEEDNSQTNIA
jgi:preprotein translocase subunit SecG